MPEVLQPNLAPPGDKGNLALVAILLGVAALVCCICSWRRESRVAAGIATAATAPVLLLTIWMFFG